MENNSENYKPENDLRNNNVPTLLLKNLKDRYTKLPKAEKSRILNFLSEIREKVKNNIFNDMYYEIFKLIFNYILEKKDIDPSSGLKPDDPGLDILRKHLNLYFSKLLNFFKNGKYANNVTVLFSRPNNMNKKIVFYFDINHIFNNEWEHFMKLYFSMGSYCFPFIDNITVVFDLKYLDKFYDSVVKKGENKIKEFLNTLDPENKLKRESLKSKIIKMGRNETLKYYYSIGKEDIETEQKNTLVKIMYNKEFIKDIERSILCSYYFEKFRSYNENILRNVFDIFENVLSETRTSSAKKGLYKNLISNDDAKIDLFIKNFKSIEIIKRRVNLDSGLTPKHYPNIFEVHEKTIIDNNIDPLLFYKVFYEENSKNLFEKVIYRNNDLTSLYGQNVDLSYYTPTIDFLDSIGENSSEEESKVFKDGMKVSYYYTDALKYKRIIPIILQLTLFSNKNNLHVENIQRIIKRIKTQNEIHYKKLNYKIGFEIVDDVILDLNKLLSIIFMISPSDKLITSNIVNTLINYALTDDGIHENSLLNLARKEYNINNNSNESSNISTCDSVSDIIYDISNESSRHYFDLDDSKAVNRVNKISYIIGGINKNVSTINIVPEYFSKQKINKLKKYDEDKKDYILEYDIMIKWINFYYARIRYFVENKSDLKNWYKRSDDIALDYYLLKTKNDEEWAKKEILKHVDEFINNKKKVFPYVIPIMSFKLNDEFINNDEIRKLIFKEKLNMSQIAFGYIFKETKEYIDKIILKEGIIKPFNITLGSILDTTDYRNDGKYIYCVKFYPENKDK